MRTIWQYLKTQKLFWLAIILPTAICALTWNQIVSKPENTIGDSGYETLATAITTIGSTNTTLIIPSNITAVGSIPANINLKFTKGGMLDTTTFPSAHPTAMAASSSVTQITKAGHGLVNGDQVIFTGISQCGATPNGDGTYSKQWMYLNYQVFTVTRTGTDTFTVPVTSTGWDAYNAGVDTGTYAKVCNILGTIDAGMYQIFNCNSPAIYLGNPTTGTRSQITLYPEWFGAKGDANAYGVGTDDWTAFSYMTTAAGAFAGGTPNGRCEIVLSRLYLLSDTWSWVNIGASSSNFVIRGLSRRFTGIVSQASGYPAWEGLAIQNVNCDNWAIYGNCEYNGTPPGAGSPSHVPSVAILISRSNVSEQEGSNSFRHMNFYGYYQYGVIHNYNNEENDWEDLSGMAYIPNVAVNNFAYIIAQVSTATDFPGVVPSLSGKGVFHTADGCLGNRFKEIRISCDGNPGMCFFFAECSTGGSVYLKDGYFSCSPAGSDTSTIDIFRIKNGGTIQTSGLFPETTFRAFVKFYTGGSAYTVSHAHVTQGGAYGTYGVYADANTTLESCVFEQMLTIYSLGNINNSKMSAGYPGSSGCYLSVAGSFNGNEVTGDYTKISIPYLDNYYNKANLFVDSRTGVNQVRIVGQNVSIGDYKDNGTSALWMWGGRYRIGFYSTTPDVNAGKSWPIGSICWNSNPASGQIIGWKCTGSGTFGTLGGGITGSIGTGTNLLTVSTVGAIELYDFIDVAGAVSNLQVRNIDYTAAAGWVITLSGNATNTVAGAAVSYHNNPTFGSMGVMP
ncbi:hypothetical protein N8192_00285 [bacterium]|nr:hypothetical protein [bacterium]